MTTYETDYRLAYRIVRDTTNLSLLNDITKVAGLVFIGIQIRKALTLKKEKRK